MIPAPPPARSAAPFWTVVLLPSAATAATVVAAPGITPQRLWIFVHLLLFVFWLGADLGVFVCTRAAARPGLTLDQRLRTLGLMRAIDVAPRLSASLMLTVGGILTEYVGISHPWWQLSGIVTLGPAWFTVVLVSYYGRLTTAGMLATRLDDALRWVLAAAVPVSVAWSWSTGRLDPAPYVAAKLLIFAALMVAGAVLRTRWRGLLRDDPGDGAVIVAALARGRPLMIAAWLGLAAAAWLGISKPGVPPADEAAPISRPAAAPDGLMLPPR